MSGAGSAAEVLRRCDQLAAISSMADGIERVYLSPEHARANAVVAGWIDAAGMRAWTDAAGNARGSYPAREASAASAGAARHSALAASAGPSPHSALAASAGPSPHSALAASAGEAPNRASAGRVLLLGSHLDTVPNAGRYDGILGVMIALAVVERLHERGERLSFGIEVLGFADEEGVRFGRTLLGSCAVAGTWDDAWWDLRDTAGATLREAFVAFGLDPARIGEAALDPARVVGYLEAHIEQGPLLLEADRPLGVVSGIMGAKRFDLSMTGEAGHAGGVPMRHRRDALLGAAETALAVEQVAIEAGIVGTVGRLEVAPGAANVIPGRADFSLDLRAATDAQRDKAWDAIKARAVEAAASRRLTFGEDLRHEAKATSSGRALSETIEAGIRAVTGEKLPMELLSKAGHDAMAIASLTRYAMLFVRCGNGGVSHHPDESVTESDVALAIDALEVAVLEVAKGEAARG